VDVPFDPAPDPTSSYIVELPEWEVISELTEIRNGQWDLISTFSLPVSNYLRETMLVVPVLVDNDLNESSEFHSHVREIYLFGQGGVFVRDFYARIKDTGNPLVTGTQLGQTPYRVRCDVGTQVELLDVTGELLTAGTGANTVVDILRSPDGGTTWESIFGAGAELTILAGEVRATASVFAIATLQRDDLVQYSIASVGTDAAGLEACLKGRVVTN
jgi:hypothetical protein